MENFYSYEILPKKDAQSIVVAEIASKTLGDIGVCGKTPDEVISWACQVLPSDEIGVFYEVASIEVCIECGCFKRECNC